MAAPAPTQSPLRRWKRFFGAFESVDAAIEAADPALSRYEFRRARVGIVEQLCDDATDDGHAERLCLVLDGVMAESLETLRLLPPPTPKVLATTDLANSVSALRKHDSGRVRVLATGIMGGWTASLQDDLAKVRAAMHKLDNVKNVIGQQAPHAEATTKQPLKIPDRDRRVLKTAKIVSEPPLPKIRAEVCSEEKLQAAKRKFREGYREAEDAKRLRKIQVVEAPEMQKQKRRSSCASSIAKKTTFSNTKNLHRV